MKHNKGFTLVELIIVIVVLAILIGVTIGGIYMYVGKSRINTDINNTKAMYDALVTMQGDSDVVSWSRNNSDKVLTMTWSKKN